MAKDPEEIPTSSLGRLLRLGGVVSSVGASSALERVVSAFLPPETRARRRAEIWARNGEKLAAALGRLKGGPMKIGQMLSLQDELLPPELSHFLRLLQKDAPPVPFERLKRVVRDDFRPYREVFAEIEPEPLASASIGQVPRGATVDGRAVAIKIQYPGIRRMIRADLKNLKGLFEVLGTIYFRIDIEPIWRELETRLLEELDYETELANQQLFRSIYQDHRGIAVPEPIPEACSGRVLTTALERGMSMDEILTERVDPEERDQWGELLFGELLAQIFEHRIVHSDPNAANFAFLPEGRVVVYDFGSVKRVPDELLHGYRAIVRAVLDRRWSDLPELIAALGIAHPDGRPVDPKLVEPYFRLFEPLLSGQHRLAGEGEPLLEEMMRRGRLMAGESRDLSFPPDAVFIHRAAAGMFGNLCRMRAKVDWGDLLDRATGDR